MKILMWPDKKLLVRAKKVTSIQNHVMPYLEDMKCLMMNANGIGLAASQVGICKSFFILSESESYEKSPPAVMINPELIDGFGETVSQESCISIPGESFFVPRAQWIMVRFQNIEGNIIEESFSGFLSIAIQHEIDHLEGITLADKASLTRRQEIIERQNC
jgi:peptide deformylase